MKSKKDEIGSLAVTFREHDHAKCASLLMAAAHNLCIARAVRLTPVREKVLELLLKSHAPLGAYDILAELSAPGLRAQPPVAYRALDFLVANGLAHRIEKINAFVACSQPHEQHSPIYMLCNDCAQRADTLL